MNIELYKHHVDAKIPTKANQYDAAFDIYALEEGDIKRETNNTCIISYETGIGINIPKNYVGYVFPRSSIKNKCLSLVNSVAVIDHGYTDEIILNYRLYMSPSYVLLSNHINGEEDSAIYDKIYKKGDRIAQIIIMPIPEIVLVESEIPQKKSRGGLGSSGS
jgi:deoxyuridine 5'-triphosphate nucleotidohydrolase